MTFREYIDAANRYYVQNVPYGQRYGQALMNFLYLVSPEKYELVTGKDIDPFYRDELIPEFINFLSDTWDNHFTN